MYYGFLSASAFHKGFPKISSKMQSFNNCRPSYSISLSCPPLQVPPGPESGELRWWGAIWVPGQETAVLGEVGMRDRAPLTRDPVFF